MKSLVIGGTLFIGRVLVSKLLQRGHQVSVLHRKPNHDLGPDVEGLQADRNDSLAVAAAIQGRTFDYVFDNVFDFTRGTTGPQVEATARLFTQLKRYVFISSVASYGETRPGVRTEDDALAPDDHPNLYARFKAMSERSLLQMHRDEGFPAVTLRPPFVYGPGNPYYREAFFWQRFADGRPVIVPEDGERIMQFVHVEDLAECEILAAEKEAAVGQAFNIAEISGVSQNDFVRTLGRVAGVAEPKMVHIAREKLVEAGGNAMGPKYYFGEYLDLPPLPQDCSKMQRMLGFTPRTLESGMAATYEWWRSGGRSAYPKADYSFEDSALSSLS
jgi:nucleoside-diphosphate-sugar epimerase